MVNQHYDQNIRTDASVCILQPPGELTKAKYQAVRPSIPSPFVKMAMVRAQARKIRKP